MTNILYLTFTFRYKTNEFGYTKELTNNSHQNLHNTISKLKHEGLGYRKISKKLNEMGIKSVTGKTFILHWCQTCGELLKGERKS